MQARPMEKLVSSDRRGAPRFEASFTTKIYKLLPNEPNQLGSFVCEGITQDISITGLAIICEGITRDISISGIAFFTNEELGSHNERYIAEFSIMEPDVFQLPVKFVRSTEVSRSDKFIYDYAFLFNCDPNSEEISKLTLSLFKYNMNRK